MSSPVTPQAFSHSAVRRAFGPSGPAAFSQTTDRERSLICPLPIFVRSAQSLASASVVRPAAKKPSPGDSPVSTSDQRVSAMMRALSVAGSGSFSIQPVSSSRVAPLQVDTGLVSLLSGTTRVENTFLKIFCAPSPSSQNAVGEYMTPSGTMMTVDRSEPAFENTDPLTQTHAILSGEFSKEVSPSVDVAALELAVPVGTSDKRGPLTAKTQWPLVYSPVKENWADESDDEEIQTDGRLSEDATQSVTISSMSDPILDSDQETFSPTLALSESDEESSPSKEPVLSMPPEQFTPRNSARGEQSGLLFSPIEKAALGTSCALMSVKPVLVAPKRILKNRALLITGPHEEQLKMFKDLDQGLTALKKLITEKQATFSKNANAQSGEDLVFLAQRFEEINKSINRFYQDLLEVYSAFGLVLPILRRIESGEKAILSEFKNALLGIDYLFLSFISARSNELTLFQEIEALDDFDDISMDVRRTILQRDKFITKSQRFLKEVTAFFSNL